MIRIFVFLLAVLIAGPVFAVQPNEVLDDPVLEKRAREIGKNLRCVVCQNQAIDDSNSDLAGDMRVLVRKRLLAGAADDEVIDYMVSRYGDYVLLQPPMKGTTYVLWFGPAAIGAIGVFALVVFFRRRRAGTEIAENAPGVKRLNDEEEARIMALLDEGGRDA